MATERPEVRRYRELPGVGWLIDNERYARVFGIVLGLAAWTALAAVFPNDLMPYPAETLVLAWDLVRSGTAYTHVASTLWLTFWGFVGSLLVGGAVGVVMGINRYGQRFFTPYIIVGLSVPAIAWAAATTLVFGFSPLAPIVATVATTFPFVAINVWKGVEGLDPDLIEMGQSFDLSNRRLLTRVVLPNAAPSLFTAMRFGLAISWKIVTIAEIFAASRGVGYKLMQSYQFYNFEETWAWAVLFMIIILAIEYGVFKPLERFVFDYRQDAEFELLG